MESTSNSINRFPAVMVLPLLRTNLQLLLYCLSKTPATYRLVTVERLLKPRQQYYQYLPVQYLHTGIRQDSYAVDLPLHYRPGFLRKWISTTCSFSPIGIGKFAWCPLKQIWLPLLHSTIKSHNCFWMLTSADL